MSAMEKSLRRALEAGDASNPAFRDTIYMASERALERMLANSDDPEAAHAQRVRLAETINRIEEDYFVAEAADDTWEAAPDPDAEHAADADYSPPARDDAFPEDHSPGETTPSEPAVEEPDAASFAATPFSFAPPAAVAASDGPATESETWSPGGARRASGDKGSKRSFKPFLLALVILLVVLFAGIYFLKSTVLGGADAGTPAAGAGATDAGSVDTASWINLFDGTQLELISTPTGGNVSAVTGSGNRPAVRLAAAGEGGEVGVVIGPGVVNTLKGHKVRVEITAGSSDGASREFSVRCLFGADTVCDRQRFTTMQDSQPFLFDMTVPASPSASGSIAIDPSFGTAKNDIDLYGVRLRDLGKA